MAGPGAPGTPIMPSPQGKLLKMLTLPHYTLLYTNIGQNWLYVRALYFGHFIIFQNVVLLFACKNILAMLAAW